MTVDILFFGVLSELATSARVHRDLPDGATLDAVRTCLESEFPAAAARLALAGVAVNQEWVQGDRVLIDGDEIAFLPPVSGG